MVDGEVETQNTDGVVRGAVERFPPSLFLRETALTQADAAIRDFAQDDPRRERRQPLAELARPAGPPARGDGLAAKRRSPQPASAAEAFARKRGVCRDLAHIFIAAAHSLGIPARYVAGYLRAPTATSARMAATPGRKPSCPISAGSASIRPTASVRPTPMCASPSGSIRSAPRRCAARATAAASETLAVAIKVDQ